MLKQVWIRRSSHWQPYYFCNFKVCISDQNWPTKFKDYALHQKCCHSRVWMVIWKIYGQKCQMFQGALNLVKVKRNNEAISITLNVWYADNGHNVTALYYKCLIIRLSISWRRSIKSNKTQILCTCFWQFIYKKKDSKKCKSKFLILLVKQAKSIVEWQIKCRNRMLCGLHTSK